MCPVMGSGCKIRARLVTREFEFVFRGFFLPQTAAGDVAKPRPDDQGSPNDSSSLTARGIALDLLEAVLVRRQAFDDALAGHRGLPALAPRDRAFARLLAATTLRRLGQLDAALAACLDKGLTPKASMVRNVLRLGAAQLLFLGTPSHAAVDSSVELATGHRTTYRGLLNAVLRRLATVGGDLVAAQDPVALNTPDWLWQSWAKAYGEPAARAIAEVHLTEPPLDLSVKRDRVRWSEVLGATVLPTGTLRRVVGGTVADLPGYDAGDWWVQDAAAALPAQLLGDITGQTVLDLCAAPGGKTAQLVASGAKVIAVDRSAARLERLTANLKRLNLTAQTVVADAELWRPAEPVSHILLDAPCSATGTIRRHPDIAHLKSPQDVVRLAALQDRLLDAAAAMLQPGGVMVYCTCSLEPEEGLSRIASLLVRDQRFRRLPITADEVGGVAELVTTSGDLRTLPCHMAEFGGLDGFYAARLEKRSG
jgi:16S rRNA (cytosine967-C5)-methyltransferase